MEDSAPVHVFKFGGTSVATAERIRSVVHIIARKPRGVRRIVVVSALGGVTNMLLEGITMALRRSQETVRLIDELRSRHTEVARELVAGEERQAILLKLNRLWHDLSELLDGVALLRECSPRSRDVIISMGERASAPLIAAAFRAEGLNAEALDADEFVRTDELYGEATVDFPVTNRLIQSAFAQIPTDNVTIVTGFVGSTDRGIITTLGRSGSDYTATILAGALGAERVEIWTDVDGVLSADPRMVIDAVSLNQLSYREASELAYFGAKVLHPRTMRPLQENGIPLYIRNTLNPEADGTLIWNESPRAPRVVKGVTAIRDMAMVIIEGTGMMGVPGIAARAFGALAEQKINVLMISQASSEQSICVIVRESRKNEAVNALQMAFEREIERGDVSGVSALPDCAVLSVVGEGMRHSPGLTGRMFATLGRMGVNVLCIAEGASDTNISAVVSEEDVEYGLEALHESFVSGCDRVHLFLIGVGTVGSRLLEILHEQGPYFEEHCNLKFELAGLTNSRRMVWNRDGIPFDEAVDRLESGRLADIESVIDELEQTQLERLIVVDATASDEVAASYSRLFDAGASIVTPNKRANSRDLAYYQRLQDTARERGLAYMYETTVGAGLPVVSTLRDLVLSGDTIHTIQGVLSGTLAYVCGRLNEGERFSKALLQARDRGYTEPDLREDLSGMDVARKILILGREMGLEANPEDVEVESLVPDSMSGSGLPLEAFVERLHELDAAFEKRQKEALEAGGRLHVIATAREGSLRVGMQVCLPDSPFHALTGTDNMIAITSERYPAESPLIIRGAGAGPDVTASGIVSDLVKAARRVG